MQEEEEAETICSAFLEEGRVVDRDAWDSLHGNRKRKRTGTYDSEEEEEEKEEEEKEKEEELSPIWERKGGRKKRKSSKNSSNELRMAKLRQKRDLERRMKGRQGRSKENREKAKIKREENSKNQPEVCYGYGSCPDCNSVDEWREDHHSGDVVCGYCGRVDSERGMGLSANFNFRSNTKSKPYQKVVHFRQRMAQLLGRDPEIQENIWNPLEALIRKELTPSQIEMMGKKKFAEMLKKLVADPSFQESFLGAEKYKEIKEKNLDPLKHGGLGSIKRLSANWIQGRRRLNCEELPHDVEGLEELYKKLCSRYVCVANVFQEKLYCSAGEKSKESALERRNILNVNYVTLQLLRLENIEVWKAWAKYFPQLVAKKQPEKNNKRWKTIIDCCKSRYMLYAPARTEEPTPLHWEFHEFSREEIERYCCFFDLPPPEKK